MKIIYHLAPTIIVISGLGRGVPNPLNGMFGPNCLSICDWIPFDLKARIIACAPAVTFSLGWFPVQTNTDFAHPEPSVPLPTFHPALFNKLAIKVPNGAASASFCAGMKTLTIIPANGVTFWINRFCLSGNMVRGVFNAIIWSRIAASRDNICSAFAMSVFALFAAATASFRALSKFFVSCRNSVAADLNSCDLFLTYWSRLPKLTPIFSAASIAFAAFVFATDSSASCIDCSRLDATKIIPSETSSPVTPNSTNASNSGSQECSSRELCFFHSPIIPMTTAREDISKPHSPLSNTHRAVSLSNKENIESKISEAYLLVVVCNGITWILIFIATIHQWKNRQR